jgi:hypothetical protein
MKPFTARLFMVSILYVSINFSCFVRPKLGEPATVEEVDHAPYHRIKTPHPAYTSSFPPNSALGVDVGVPEIAISRTNIVAELGPILL